MVKVFSFLYRQQVFCGCNSEMGFPDHPCELKKWWEKLRPRKIKQLDKISQADSLQPSVARWGLSYLYCCQLLGNVKPIVMCGIEILGRGSTAKVKAGACPKHYPLQTISWTKILYFLELPIFLLPCFLYIYHFPDSSPNSLREQ